MLQQHELIAPYILWEEFLEVVYQGLAPIPNDKSRDTAIAKQEAIVYERVNTLLGKLAIQKHIQTPSLDMYKRKM